MQKIQTILKEAMPASFDHNSLHLFYVYFFYFCPNDIVAEPLLIGFKLPNHALNERI